MKKEVKVIKGDTTLKRTASGCVERSIKRVAAYCRVSTDTEDQINSYNSQVEHYTEFIQKNNEWTLAGIYADEAITGTQVDRRIDFQRLINDCMNGDIDMIITKSISRFARNTLDTLKYVRKLKEFNVAVFFEEENINTLTMDGELLLTILSSVAQQEVENISANVKKGLRMKMERGEMVGFQGCLGYDYDPETKSISINEKEAEIVRYIFRRYIEGVGGMVISRELEEQGYLSPRGNKRWTETTVLGIIKNEKYKGDLMMGKTYTVDPISKRRLDNYGEQDKFYIENHHEPIISEEDFEKAQGIRLRRSKNRNTVANNGGKREKYSRKYAFSSMLECGFCGHNLSRRNWHSSSEYTKVIWQCVNATKNGKKYCPHSKGIEEEAIEKAFMESYRQVCHNNVEITNEFLKTVEEELKDNSLAKDLKKISNQLDKILKKEKDLVELRLNEAISMEIYQEEYNEIAISKEKLLEEKRTLEVTLTDEKALKKRLEGFKKLLESNKYLEEFDRAVFESIVDKIIIGGTNDEGEIDPAMITIIYKTGKKDSQNGRLFKSRRKNAKVVEENDGDKLYSQSSNEVNKLYSYSTDNTCGASGIMPAILYYCYKQLHIEKKDLIKALAVGGIFGNVVKTNATISGADGGCQAEVGSACAMAAATMAWIYELNNSLIEYAAEMGLEHNLGLTCDPVGGYVQIPCIERNGYGSLRALDAAMLAKQLGYLRKNKVSFDAIVRVMKETGKDLSSAYKETSLGGLAKEFGL